MKKNVSRKIILILISFSLLFTSGMSFAYWASQVFGNSNQNTGNIQLGQWPWGTPIYTVNDFVTAVTTNQETPQDYFLANDLDFNNVMPGNWIENNEILFKGTLDGNGKTLYNVVLTARRGIIGVLDGGTVKNLTIHNANVTYNTSQSTTTGILVGRIQGTGALIENVIITNSSVSSNVLSGGLAGLIQPATGGSPGTVTINNVSITGTTVSGAGSFDAYGNGGFVGTINNMSVSMNNVTAQTNTTSTGTASAGGLIGALREVSSVTIQNATVTNSTVTTSAANTVIGTGGAIGRLVGTGNVLNGITVSGTTVTSGNSPAGGLIGNADQTGGSLFITNTTLASTQVNSALNNATFGNGGVIGTLSGYALTMNQVSASANVTNSSASNAGGIIGYVASGSINLTDTSAAFATVQINGTGTALGAGGIIGQLRGTGHQFTKIRVNQMTVNSASASGGVIGYATQASGTAQFNNIKVTGGSINSSINNATVGTGGLIGHTLSYTHTINDLYVESSLSTNNANIGGVIGYIGSGSATMNRIVVFSDLIMTNPGNNTDRGAGGIIGRNSSGTQSSVTDMFYSGKMRARINQNQPHIGILVAKNNNLAGNRQFSAGVYYWVSTSNPEQLVNTSTLYDRMRGQSPGWATHTVDLSNFDWNNLTNITGSTLWTYDSVRNIYYLI